MPICRKCDGKGKYLAMGEEDCPLCHGLGRDLKSNLWNQPCRYTGCKNGRITYCRHIVCDHCHGSGQVPY